MNKRKAKFVESILKKVISKTMTAKEASIKLNYARQYIYFLLAKYKKYGFSSLIHKNKNSAPINKINDEKETKIINLYKTEYSGFNFKHFQEMLLDNEKIFISYCALYRILTSACFVSPKHHKKRKVNNTHPSRPRRHCFGELIQLDASIHKWFGETKYTLHAAIDDATSAVVGAFFDKEETLHGYYMVLKQILENYGIPQEFYTDRRTIFDYRSLDEKHKTIERNTFVQFKRCSSQLGIEIHTTSVSQAKGRVERLFNTYQDRLISEMRLNNINNVEDANAFLQEYIKKHNKKFASSIDFDTSLFAPAPSEDDINLYLSIEYHRITDNGSSFSFKNKRLQLIDKNGEIVSIPPKTKIRIFETLDKGLLAIYDSKIYETTISIYVKPEKEKKKGEKYIPPANHPWRRYINSMKDK
jgi:transposase